jgi:C-terminal processing protease CtpA/Prc
MINKNQVFTVSRCICIFTLSILAVFFPVSTGCSNPLPGSINNICAFTRLYGYVKYFYPGDEAAAMDWERFAIYGIKRVEKARDPGELKKILEELFLPIAPALVIHESLQKTEFSIAGITPPNPAGMKVVAWQHQGVGFGNANSIYKSVRLNRKTVFSSENNIGNIFNQVDAAPYRGKKIKMKAAVRVAEGIGQLWIRVDRERQQIGFFDNMDDRPIKSDRWKYYEFIGTVDKDAQQVFFGCFLRGGGRLWADDFQMYARENEGSDQWKPVDIKNPGFEKDMEGEAPKEWSAGSVEPGYIFQVTSGTAANGSKSVSIKSQAITITGPLPDFQPQPGIGEYIARELGPGLSCIMPIALYGTDEYTYPPSDQKDLEPLQTALKKEVPDQFSGDDRYVRLADIVIAWNIFQHFFPYFDVVKTNWKASLTEALNDSCRDKTKQDFLKTLEKFTAGLKDGHVRVTLIGDESSGYTAPIQWDWVENRLVITGIYESKPDNLYIGDVVTALDGVKAEEAYRNQARYISAATEGWKRYRTLKELLEGPKDSTIRLKIERNGKSHQVALTRSLTWIECDRASKKDRVQYKKIEEGILYLDLDRIPMDEINKLMPELEKARAIICDLRGYPNSNHGLINHLLKEKENSRWLWVPQIIYPDYERVTYRKTGWNEEPVKPTLTAKVVFITDGRAISYAESFLAYIEGFQLATIVGQPTAGTNGNVNLFTLPGGYRITWTGMRVLKHDGSPHHGVGIIPHVRVERTIQGVKAGRDEFLEKAIEIAKNRK